MAFNRDALKTRLGLKGPGFAFAGNVDEKRAANAKKGSKSFKPIDPAKSEKVDFYKVGQSEKEKFLADTANDIVNPDISIKEAANKNPEVSESEAAMAAGAAEQAAKTGDDPEEAAVETLKKEAPSSGKETLEGTPDLDFELPDLDSSAPPEAEDFPQGTPSQVGDAGEQDAFEAQIQPQPEGSEEDYGPGGVNFTRPDEDARNREAGFTMVPYPPAPAARPSTDLSTFRRFFNQRQGVPTNDVEDAEWSYVRPAGTHDVEPFDHEEEQKKKRKVPWEVEMFAGNLDNSLGNIFGKGFRFLGNVAGGAARAVGNMAPVLDYGGSAKWGKSPDSGMFLKGLGEAGGMLGEQLGELAGTIAEQKLTGTIMDEKARQGAISALQDDLLVKMHKHAQELIDEGFFPLDEHGKPIIPAAFWNYMRVYANAQAVEAQSYARTGRSRSVA